MKIIFLSIFLIGELSSLGEALPSRGVPFPTNNIEIIWEAPTNQLPRSMWSYRTIPQEFSDAVISNLMSLGSFAMSNRMRPPDPIPDKKLLHFRDDKENPTRSLTIAPTLGWIEYWDERAQASMEEAVVRVPDEAQTMKLAKDYLFLLGIDHTQVNDERPIKSVGNRGRLDEYGKALTKELLNRGISMVRRVNGIDAIGEDFSVKFGNNGRIMRLGLTWRNLVPFETHETASSQQIVEWIKGGRAFWLSKGNPADFKKLTVTKITPYYQSQPGDKPLEVIYPFAVVDIKADLGHTNITFSLDCPIYKSSR